MAVNETIVTNRYFRRCTDAANKVWQRISFWHKASDCEFDDGSTAQTKVGAIKGITTSTSVTETGYAADMTTVKGLQTQIDELNSNLGSDIKYVTSNSSVLVIRAGTTTAEFTIPATGHKKYLIYVSQTRNAYNMTFTVTSGGNNVKSITFLNKSTNQVAAIIEVTNLSSDFSINGTAYNGDDSSSSAQITYVVFAI